MTHAKIVVLDFGSQVSMLITRRLRGGLGLVDIQMLDHLVIGDGQAVSFAERGLL